MRTFESLGGDSAVLEFSRVRIVVSKVGEASRRAFRIVGPRFPVAWRLLLVVEETGGEREGTNPDENDSFDSRHI